jgi:hypothetical protein
MDGTVGEEPTDETNEAAVRTPVREGLADERMVCIIQIRIKSRSEGQLLPRLADTVPQSSHFIKDRKNHVLRKKRGKPKKLINEIREPVVIHETRVHRRLPVRPLGTTLSISREAMPADEI